MKKYNVTIGMPVYKSVDSIRRSLLSALNQSYFSIEFLIVDDCGFDGSLDIIEQLKGEHPRGDDIHIVCHAQNLGVSTARNHIIEEAQGDFLYFMDSDDMIAEDTIELLMKNVCQYDAEIAFGSYEKILTSGERIVYQYPSLQLLGKDKLAEFAYRKYGGIQASACNYLVKTSILRDNHLRFIDTNYWEDMVFTFDLVTYITRAVLLPTITYSYLCRENSLSHYQFRNHISKGEVLQNVKAIDHLKESSLSLYNKAYFGNRCYNIVMTDFYIACTILKRRKEIIPSITNGEIRNFMKHPATLCQIVQFNRLRLSNLFLYALTKMPSSWCVTLIRFIGKKKQLI